MTKKATSTDDNDTALQVVVNQHREIRILNSTYSLYLYQKKKMPLASTTAAFVSTENDKMDTALATDWLEQNRNQPKQNRPNELIEIKRQLSVIIRLSLHSN